MTNICQDTWTAFEDFLFSKGYLVNHSGEDRQDCVRVLYALASVFGIKVKRNPHLAVWRMAAAAARIVGTQVPEPFYTGFPQSVLKLTEDLRLIDQLVHYSVTYSLGDFSKPGHSFLEEEFQRLAFREKTEIREFDIVEEAEALELLKTYVTAMLASSRPLGRDSEALAVQFVRLFPDTVTACPCKDTAIRLLIETRDLRFARFLHLPDVIRLADEINFTNGLPSAAIKKQEMVENQRKKLLDELLRQKKEEYDLNLAAYQRYLAELRQYETERKRYLSALENYTEKKRAFDHKKQMLTSIFPDMIAKLFLSENDMPIEPIPPTTPVPVSDPGSFIPPTIPVVRAKTKKTTAEKPSIKARNLRNRDRKLISSVIDFFFSKETPDIRECYEKRKLWSGLLHHIHYQPKNEAAAGFVQAMREKKKNRSVWSAFEAAMAENDILKAADLLKAGKGTGAVARSLNYMLSRCQNGTDVDELIGRLGSLDPIILIQMITQYKHYRTGARTFRFVRRHMLATHYETVPETKARRSVLPEQVRAQAETRLREILMKKLAEKAIGKVYVEDGMEKISIPLQEGTGSSGFGVLPRGSRVRLPEGNKLRCFTYWEKVDDIDLACFGLGEDGTFQEEFSWRTMWESQDKCITFSGDETSGYHGGSEFFDVQVPRFREVYPDIRYLVFTDNVFSEVNFDRVICTAGYMIREEEDSGKIFEPKTVKSSFHITVPSTYAVLFALDLKEREIVWLNLGMDSSETIAGDSEIAMVLDYLDAADIFNLSMMFRGMSTEVVSRPEDADVIVADRYTGELCEGQQLIRSVDHEKILGYLNGPEQKKQ